MLLDHLQKTKKEYKSLKKTRDSWYIYQNEIDKACFQHDMVYGEFKDLARRTASEDTLPDKAFNITKNLKNDGYQKGFASIVYKFFDKKTLDGTVKNENISNKELAGELHKSIIRRFEKRKVHSPFIDNI